MPDAGDEKTEQDYREDGWPLCPRCENDELWSPKISGAWANSPDWTAPFLEEYFAEPFRCYYCNWEGRIEPHQYRPSSDLNGSPCAICRVKVDDHA